MKIKMRLFAVLMALSLGVSKPAYCDSFGADLVILIKILSNAIQQYYQLMAIVNQGKDQLKMMKEIHKGIHNTLKELKSVDPNFKAGLHTDWNNPEAALSALQELYGGIAESSEAGVQKDIDQGAAEAISMNNKLYEYAEKLDAIGENIKRHSQNVSPGGAAKLTAQSMGVMIHVMDQSLRTQATALKLQAQNMANQNKKDKVLTKHILESSSALKNAMNEDRSSFAVPRF